MEVISQNMQKQTSDIENIRKRKAPLVTDSIYVHSDSRLMDRSDLAASVNGIRRPKRRFQFDMELLEKLILKQLEDKMNNSRSSTTSVIEIESP